LLVVTIAYAQESSDTAIQKPVLTSPVTMYVTAKGGLNVRSEPSISGKIVHTLLYGTQIGIQKWKSATIDGITDYWCRVWYDGWYGFSHAGYVFGGYLSATRPTDISPIQIIGNWHSDKGLAWGFERDQNVLYGAWCSEPNWIGIWSLSDNVLTIPWKAYYVGHEFASKGSGMTMTIKIIDTNNIELHHQDGSIEKLVRIIE
jgi:hypothetical protein